MTLFSEKCKWNYNAQIKRQDNTKINKCLQLGFFIF